MSTESVMPSNHLILCCSLLLLPSVFPKIRDFSRESVLRFRWSKYWSFSFSTSPSNEYSGLISFRINWFDLLAVQGTLKSLLQHHSSKASILQGSVFFVVQLSHPYMTTGKIIALTRGTFLPRSRHLLGEKLWVSTMHKTKCAVAKSPGVQSYFCVAETIVSKSVSFWGTCLLKIALLNCGLHQSFMSPTWIIKLSWRHTYPWMDAKLLFWGKDIHQGHLIWACYWYLWPFYSIYIIGVTAYFLIDLQ